jgi:Secretion system C-terminal sorting domain
MKKLYTLSFSLLAFAGFSQTIPFTGTGTLDANGWTLHSGIAGQLQTVASASDSGNSLAFVGLAASSVNRTAIVAGNTEDANFPTTAAITGTVYYSALIKVTSSAEMQPNTSTIGDYFLAANSNAGATVGNLAGRLYVRQGAAANTFNLGVLNISGGTATPAFIATDNAIGTTFFVVVKYVLATSTASLYVNPVPGAAEPAVASATNATGTTVAPAQIASIAIRQGGSATAGTGNVEIDEIRISDNWATVTPNNLSVKQNSIAGLKVYPNPVTNGTLFVDTDSNSEKNIVVYDVLGKQVLNTTTANNAVNVSRLNSGVYIVKVTEDGKTATRKLVIR